ncbi:hypothetical protein [Clavibacter tessellarius]|uniref:hypothetical protein n=1 Tax=Clavibacter tessellarius TaxID=31965 RepID=UPI0032530814
MRSTELTTDPAAGGSGRDDDGAHDARSSADGAPAAAAPAPSLDPAALVADLALLAGEQAGALADALVADAADADALGVPSARRGSADADLDRRTGGSCYVDRYAGDLAGLTGRIPYLVEPRPLAPRGDARRRARGRRRPGGRAPGARPARALRARIRARPRRPRRRPPRRRTHARCEPLRDGRRRRPPRPDPRRRPRGRRARLRRRRRAARRPARDPRRRRRRRHRRHRSRPRVRPPPRVRRRRPPRRPRGRPGRRSRRARGVRRPRRRRRCRRAPRRRSRAHRPRLGGPRHPLPALLSRSLERRGEAPAGTAWTTRVRDHDALRWAFDDDDARALGIDPDEHRRFLTDFHLGRFAGSHARGVAHPAGVAGTTASLAGLEQDDPGAAERILLAHSIALSTGGLPVLVLGDEVGQLNDYGYDDVPAHADDSRWINRPLHPFERYDQREDRTTSTGVVHAGIRRLVAVRGATPALGGTRVVGFDAHHPHVLGYQRPHADGTVLVLANLGDEAATVEAETLGGFAEHAVDLVRDERLRLTKGIVLSPRTFVWLQAAPDLA